MAFADDLRAEGHTVHTPDLYAGATFDDVEAGVAHAKSIGFDVLTGRARDVASLLRKDLVYAGFSLGVVPAQTLAQTRRGARGAVFMHAAIPPSEFETPWPAGVPMQIHTMEGDELGDVGVARELAAANPDVQLYLYPGSGHLFTDRGTADYDAAAAALVRDRFLELLAGLG